MVGNTGCRNNQRSIQERSATPLEDNSGYYYNKNNKGKNRNMSKNKTDRTDKSNSSRMNNCRDDSYVDYDGEEIV